MWRNDGPKWRNNQSFLVGFLLLLAELCCLNRETTLKNWTFLSSSSSLLIKSKSIFSLILYIFVDEEQNRPHNQPATTNEKSHRLSIFCALLLVVTVLYWTHYSFQPSDGRSSLLFYGCRRWGWVEFSCCWWYSWWRPICHATMIFNKNIILKFKCPVLIWSVPRYSIGFCGYSLSILEERIFVKKR